jgi:putative transposase
MSRIARAVAPGVPHHVTQRGNNRQDVFFADADRELYLSILASQCARYHLELLGYCLMTNHIHLIAIPGNPESLAKAIGRTHWIYAQHLNSLHGRTGHLWQNRFFSCPMDGPHLVTAMAYLELNPVRARLARKAWDYPWSSAAAHVNGDDPRRIVSARRWKDFIAMADWSDYLASFRDHQADENIRLATMRGRPLGDDSFVAKIESTLGCRLRPSPVGRPPKSAKV